MRSQYNTVPAHNWLLENLASKPIVADIDHTLGDVVRKAVEELDEPHRSLLELSFWQRATYQEIAEIMGYGSKGSAYFHVHKAMEVLRRKLYEIDYDTFCVYE